MRDVYSNEILAGIKAVQREDKRWIIELQPGRFLHWIETTNHRPVTVSDPRFTMQSWNFREEAEGIILYLRRLWNTDPIERAKADEPIIVSVDTKAV